MVKEKESGHIRQKSLETLQVSDIGIKRQGQFDFSEENKSAMMGAISEVEQVSEFGEIKVRLEQAEAQNESLKAQLARQEQELTE